jgi:hypothetical protein
MNTLLSDLDTPTQPMSIQLTTTPDTLPFDVLDVSVQTRRRADQSWLLVQVRGRRGQQTDRQWQMPGLSWFDAHQLRQFATRMTRPGPVGTYRVELTDAGVLLIGSAAGSPAGRSLSLAEPAGRTIRVEPLPGAERTFAPFILSGTRADMSYYAGRLSQRMWEAFLQQ